MQEFALVGRHGDVYLRGALTAAVEVTHRAAVRELAFRFHLHINVHRRQDRWVQHRQDRHGIVDRRPWPRQWLGLGVLLDPRRDTRGSRLRCGRTQRPQPRAVLREWTAPPWSTASELMWIGLADEQGRSWYGISSEVAITPSTNAFIAGAFRLISPDELRMTRAQLAAAVSAFCGEVDEFWAWIPTVESFATFFGLGDQALAVFTSYWDVDLQMLRGLVQPWPNRLHDLNAAAGAAGVQIPARAANHLHPRVHAEWNRSLFERIRASRNPE